MIQEDKKLLLKDLCTRLPYGVICKVEFKDNEGWKIQNMSLKGVFINECYFTTDTGSVYSKEFKPYLRLMSSMTEEEKKELQEIAVALSYNKDDRIIGTQVNSFRQLDGVLDLFNLHHLDWRGLIKKGLALKAPEGMYNLKN